MRHGLKRHSGIHGGELGRVDNQDEVCLKQSDEGHDGGPPSFCGLVLKTEFVVRKCDVTLVTNLSLLPPAGPTDMILPGNQIHRRKHECFSTQKPPKQSANRSEADSNESWEDGNIKNYTPQLPPAHVHLLLSRGR